jgi:hypothetical protein
LCHPHRKCLTTVATKMSQRSCPSIRIRCLEIKQFC